MAGCWRRQQQGGFHEGKGREKRKEDKMKKYGLMGRLIRG